jgi:hypothetical protein
LKRAGAWLVIATLAAHVAPARASEEPLSLSLVGCSALSEAALREHLALELTTLGLSRAPGRLQLRCEPASVVVSWSDADGARAPMVTRVELQDTARGARERLVALAVSELVAQSERARRAEQERAPLPAVVTAKPLETARSQPPPPNARRSPGEVSAAASAAAVGEPRALLWGASIGARFRVGDRATLLLDGHFERGGDQLSLAEVRWLSLSGLLGAALRTSAGPLELSAGLGLRAGWLSLAASAQAPDEGGSFTAPWAGVALPLRAALATGSVRPFLGVEGGYVTLPVRGTVNDGGVLVEHRGAWLTASLGVALAL